MAKKKEDLDFDYEDEEEAGDDEEYAEEDADEDSEEDFDEEEDEDEEGGKRGGGAARIAILAVLFLGAVGAGAFAFMSSGGNLPFLSDLPLPFLKQATPVPVALSPSGFANPNFETRKPATASQGEATGSGAGTAAAPAKTAAPAAAAVVPPPAPTPAAPKATPRPAQQAAAPPPVEQSPDELTTPALPETPAVAEPKPAIKRVATGKGKRAGKRQHRWREARHAPHRRSVRTGAVGYSVQVGAFAQPANAERLIASLRAQGFPAYGSGGAGGRPVTGGQFHVRSNLVDSRQKASQLANQFRLAGWTPRVVGIPGGHYVLHVGTFGTQEQASNLVADLNAKGLFATVSGRVGTRASAAGGGGPNRVWVGNYSSRSEAEATASKLRAAVGAAIVVHR